MGKGNAALIGLAAAMLSAAPASAGAALMFSEIMYDLPGSDTDREWIEVVNCGPDAVTVATGSGSGGWRFNDGANHILNAPVQGNATLNPNAALVLAADVLTFLAEHPGIPGTVMDTVMNLKNTSSTLQIIDGSGAVAASATYESSMGAKGTGRTLERLAPCGSPAGPWQESAADGGTPGTVAETAPPPSPPPPPPAGPTPSVPTPPSGSNPQPPPKLLPHVALSEFLPDPVGDDSTGEWIEIVNPEDREADISGLMLDDNTTGGAYVFPDKTIIAPSGYLIVPRAVSKIALTNTGDVVRLMWPSGEFIETVSFGKAPEGAAYAKDAGGSWRWTYRPTRATANVFTEKPEQPKASTPTTTAPLPQQPPDTESEYEGRVAQTPQSTQTQAQAARQPSLNAGIAQPPQRTSAQPVAAPTEPERASTLSPTSSATTSQLLAASLPSQPSSIPPWLFGVGTLAGGIIVGVSVSRFLLHG